NRRVSYLGFCALASSADDASYRRGFASGGRIGAPAPLDERRDFLQIHVASRDERYDADPLRDGDASREQRGGRRGAGALDVELGARQKHAHRLENLLLRDIDDLVDGL